MSKYILWTILSIFCILTVLTGCSSESDEPSLTNETVTLKKLNLAGAKYLTKVAPSNRSRGAEDEDNIDNLPSDVLLKVDNQGNVSAVGVTYSSDGTTTTKKLLVASASPVSLTEDFTLLPDCKFLYEDGAPFEGYVSEIQKEHKPGWDHITLLVRNSDGKLYVMIGYDLPEIFSDYYMIRETFKGYNGETFVKMDDAVYRINVIGENVSCQRVTPKYDSIGKVYPLSNGTLVGFQDDNLTFFYPNGGLQDYNIKNEDAYLSIGMNGNLLGVSFPDSYLQIYKYEIGTTFGSLRKGEAILEPTTIKFEGAHYVDNIIETPKYYIVGNWGAVDKTTKEFTSFPEQIKYDFEELRYYGVVKEYLFGNKVWSVSDDSAKWFDLNDFKVGEVSFKSITQRFQITSRNVDIPHGKYYIYGYDYLDGCNVACVIDITDGSTTIVHSPDNREITTLVPVNYFQSN